MASTSQSTNAAAQLSRTKTTKVQHFADGGFVRSITDRLYGNVPPPPAPTPAPAAPAPTPSAASQLSNISGYAGGMGLEKRMKAQGLRDGGIVTHAYKEGGKVTGPGTATSDSIPAMLSHGEVVMPADTVQKVGAAKLLATIDATHVPTGHPAMKDGMQARADGGYADPGDVTRVGNSYSGGNVSGNIAINGQAPAGTFSALGGGAAAALSTPTPGIAAPAAPAAPVAAFDPASGVGRPNALGSMADTNAQLAALQKSNADTSHAGYSGVLGGAAWMPPPITGAPPPGGAAAALSNTAASPPGSITSLRPSRPQAPPTPPAPGAAAAGAAAAAATPTAAPPAAAKPPAAGTAFGLGAPAGATAFGLGKPYAALADGGMVIDPREEAINAARRLSTLPAQAAPVTDVIGRQPAKFMGMADVVQPAQIAGPAAAQGAVAPVAAPTPPATVAAPAPGAEVIGRRPNINGGMADVVGPQQIGQTPAAAAPKALGAPAAAAEAPLAAAGGNAASRLMTVGKVAGPVIGAALEGKQVYDVAQDPNSTGYDVAAQAATGVGRLASAGAGAAGGAALGALGGPLAPVTVPLGGLIGGVAGYYAADKAIDGGRALTGSSPTPPTPPAAPIGPLGSGRGANEIPGQGLTPPPAAVPPAAVPPPAAPPVDNRTKSPNEPPPLVAKAAAAPPVVAAEAPGATPAAPLGGMADTQRQLANLQASNADTSHAGFSGVIGGSPLGLSGDERQKFFDEANLRTAAAKGTWSPRKGYQGDETAVAAAMAPINARNALAQTTAKEAGDTLRAGITEKGADARARLADTRAASETAINQQRLGLEGKKLTLDTARDDRAAAAAAPKLAIEANKAKLQAVVIDPTSTPQQRKEAANSIANLEGKELSGNAVPVGYERTADGNLKYTKGGPADPDTPKGKNNLTDTQGKALQFGSRMQAANEIFDDLAKQGRLYSTPGAGLPGAGLLTDANAQKLDQAKRNFVNAVLRRESGAAIAPSEFESADKQYFPVFGEDAATTAQKKANRELSMRGILAEVPDSDTRVRQVRGLPPLDAKAGPAQAPRINSAADVAALPSGTTFMSPDGKMRRKP